MKFTKLILSAFAVLLLTGSLSFAEQGWKAKLHAPDVNAVLSGTVYDLAAAAGNDGWLSAEVFAEGWQGNNLACEDLDFLTADIFFGSDSGRWELQILYDITLQDDGSWRVLDTLIAYAELTSLSFVSQEWDNSEDIEITIKDAGCVGDRFRMVLDFKGRLENLEDGSPINVSGSTTADFSIFDMEEY